MSLSALVRLYQTVNWAGLPDGKGMRRACELAIIERLQSI